MTIPVRSIRLQRRSSTSLDTLSGASGEIFFDSDRNTLRLYTANQADNVILADREWVLENTFTGNWADVVGAPPIASDVSQLTDNFNLLFSGDYNDLLNAPDLDGLDISTIDSIGDVDTTTAPLVSGQLLQWDGTNWVNTTVDGAANTTYDFASGSVTGGASLTLSGSDASTDIIEVVGGGDTTVSINLSGQIEISTTSSTTLEALSDTAISNPQDGQLLGYNSGQWINVAAPSGGSFDGAFSSLTGTPTTIAGYGITDAYTANQSLDTTSSPEFRNTTIIHTGGNDPGLTIADQITEASATSLSIERLPRAFGDLIRASILQQGTTFRVAASGQITAGGITYPITDGTAGQVLTTDGAGSLSFTTVSGGSGISNIVEDTTPQLGGNLDLNSFNITGVGNIDYTGTLDVTGDITTPSTVTADSFVATGSQAPAITSTTDIVLTAPDGVTITDDGTNSVVIDAGNISVSNGKLIQFGTSGQSFIQASATQITLGSANASVVAGDSSVILNGITTFLGGSRETTHYISGATGIVVHDITLGGVFAHKTPSADWTANFTNVPTDTGNTISLALIVIQGTTPYLPTAVQIGGAAQTILWQGGAAPTGTADGIDIISFTLIRDFPLSLWTVIGSGTSYS